MKVVIIILSAAILCGCHKQEALPSSSDASFRGQKWEYKSVTVWNSTIIDYSEGERIWQTNNIEGRKKMDNAEKSSGDFGFNNLFLEKTTENSLEKLGDQGWELVAAVPQTETIGAAKFSDGVDFVNGKIVYKDSPFSNTRTAKIFLIFKRQK